MGGPERLQQCVQRLTKDQRHGESPFWKPREFLRRAHETVGRQVPRVQQFSGRLSLWSSFSAHVRQETRPAGVFACKAGVQEQRTGQRTVVMDLREAHRM